MRREVLTALSALSVAEHQRKIWVQREYLRLNYFDDLTQNIHVVALCDLTSATPGC